MKNRNSQFTKMLLIALLACVAVFFSTSATQAAEAPFIGHRLRNHPRRPRDAVARLGRLRVQRHHRTVGRATYCETSLGPPTSTLTPATEATSAPSLGLVARRLDLRPLRGHSTPTDEEGVFDNRRDRGRDQWHGPLCQCHGLLHPEWTSELRHFLTFEAPFEGTISRP